jgi:acylphosphatase
MVYMDIPMQKCHSIIVTGKVQDIGFRSVVEHIGRSFGMPGLVFNAKDGSVRILCCGEDRVIDNFTHTIRVRGKESGAEIEDIKEQLLPFNIDLPDEFSRVSSDEDIDFGRKLDKGNLLLATMIIDNKTGFNDLNTNLNTGFNDLNTNLNTGFNDLNTNLNTGFNNLNTDLNTGFNNLNTDLNTGFNNLTTMMYEHNTRLEAILEKLANR